MQVSATTRVTSHEASEINAGVEIYWTVTNNNTNKSNDVGGNERRTSNSAEIETATNCSALR